VEAVKATSPHLGGARKAQNATGQLRATQRRRLAFALFHSGDTAAATEALAKPSTPTLQASILGVPSCDADTLRDRNLREGLPVRIPGAVPQNPGKLPDMDRPRIISPCCR
jgi:hypothetical protein